MFKPIEGEIRLQILLARLTQGPEVWRHGSLLPSYTYGSEAYKRSCNWSQADDSAKGFSSNARVASTRLSNHMVIPRSPMAFDSPFINLPSLGWRVSPPLLHNLSALQRTIILFS